MKKKSYKIRKFDIAILVICLAILSWFFANFLKGGQELERLPKEGITDTAIIVREFAGAKGNRFYEYVFFISGSKYNGFLGIQPNIGNISIGDSILIKYLPSDPDNINAALRYNNRKVVKVNSNENCFNDIN
jgi:hypothetical protein